METRQITQIKIWKLILNPMTGNTEDASLVAISDSRDKLLDWYRGERAVEPYVSIGESYFSAKGDFPENLEGQHRYHKVFKQGSRLEWMNPMYNKDELDHYGHGINWEWVSEDTLSGINIFRI